VAAYLAYRRLDLQVAGSNPDGETFSARNNLEHVIHMYIKANYKPFFFGVDKLAPASRLGLKSSAILQGAWIAARNACKWQAILVCSYSPDVTTWRNYSTERHTCVSITNVKQALVFVESRYK